MSDCFYYKQSINMSHFNTYTFKLHTITLIFLDHQILWINISDKFIHRRERIFFPLLAASSTSLLILCSISFNSSSVAKLFSSNCDWNQFDCIPSERICWFLVGTVSGSRVAHWMALVTVSNHFHYKWAVLMTWFWRNGTASFDSQHVHAINSHPRNVIPPLLK